MADVPSLRIGSIVIHCFDYEPGADYVVLEDPDGNLFCVIEAGDKVES